MPAADNLTALYAMTAFQTLIGVTMLRTVRLRWRDKTFWGTVTRIANATAGTYVLFNSGLEISRLALPYDPWYDEAKKFRQEAIAAGKKPNWWLGPLDMKQMSLAEWNAKMDVWIADQEDNLERQSTTLVGSPEIEKGYLKIRDLNNYRQSQILQQLQSGTFKEFLPSYQSEGPKPNSKKVLVIPEDITMEDDWDFIQVWELSDPWQSLAESTSIFVRLIPSSLDQQEVKFFSDR